VSERREKNLWRNLANNWPWIWVPPCPQHVRGGVFGG